MAKLVLEIGLVAGEERFCNSCFLLSADLQYCWGIREKVPFSTEGKRVVFYRDTAKCPLKTLDQAWKDKEGFSLA
jgi:hypothetical protein